MTPTARDVLAGNAAWSCDCADALAWLRSLPADSVHCCVTSPPYWGLRDYGVAGQLGLEPTPAGFVERLVAIFRELRRVLHPSGTVWVNLGDSYAGSWGAQSRGHGGKHAANVSAISANQIRAAHRKSSGTGHVPNLTDFLNSQLKGGMLFYGRPDPRTPATQRPKVLIYDQSSPDGVLMPLLRAKRITIKQGEHYLGEVGHGFDSPVECWVSERVGRRIAADSDSEGFLDLPENVRVVVTAADADTDPAFRPRLNPVKDRQATLSVEVAGEPPAEGVARNVPVRDAFASHTFRECHLQIDAVCKAVSLADGLHLPACTRGHLRATEAGEQKVLLAGVGVEIQFDDTHHVHLVCEDGIVPYSRLLDKARRHRNRYRAKQEIGVPFMVRDALMEDGWICRQTIVWHKPNPMPHSVQDRCSPAHEYIFLLAKSPTYFFDNVAIFEPAVSAGRPMTRAAGWAEGKGRHCPTVQNGRGGGRDTGEACPATRNKRSVWKVSGARFKGAHFATFPAKLVEPCVLAGTSEKGVCPRCWSPWVRQVRKTRVPTRPGVDTKCLPHSDGDTRTAKAKGWSKPLVIGNRDPRRHVTRVETVGWNAGCDCPAAEPIPAVVLDMFAGSGTTLAEAVRLGRRAVGCELNPQYIADHVVPRMASVGGP